MPTVTSVDLHRYQGDWYVIASIPSYFERHAYNAVESYLLRPDGKIQTSFRYRRIPIPRHVSCYRSPVQPSVRLSRRRASNNTRTSSAHERYEYRS